MDTYFPFDAGAGAGATEVLWRKMARVWAMNGVVKGIGNQLSATFTAPSTLTVQAGAVWVDGFYGENTGAVTFTMGSASGLLVARADPTANTVGLYWESGFSPTQSFTNTYELPLFAVDAATLYDLRPQAGVGTEIGDLLWSPRPTGPLGFVSCNGAFYRQDIYAAAYAALGSGSTAFGTGTSGSNATFAVPDLRGRSPMGAGAGTGLTSRTLGTKTGEESHTLTTAEMPSHKHTPDPASSAGIGDTLSTKALPAVADAGTSSVKMYAQWGPFDTTATGGGGAHNTVHPVQVLNAYIRLV